MIHPVTTPRLRDWQSRLSAFLASRKTSPFAWGSNDCCLFAADGVQVITGFDAASDLRGSYYTALTAARVVEAHGGMEGIASAALGEPVPVSLARVGDVGLIHHARGQSLAICTGQQWQCPSDNGLARLQLSAASLAWRVQ